MTKLTRQVDVVLEGRGIVSISPRDHMATGGEGSVYKKNNTVIKLYLDPHKMRKDGMVEKIALLKKCAHPFIITPLGVVTTVSGDAIGYYMNYAQGEPLSRVFTNDYRARSQFTDEDANKLIDGMRTVVEHAHKNHAIMVDANELNWLVDDHKKNKPEPRAIDVDAWAIGRWGARVIMPSIRDWRSTMFNELTDWFSWGIVTFQVYTGIHPYKGRINGYNQNDLERRMKDNVSVFHKDVRLNHAVRDFNNIPGALRMWYEDVFAKGKRTKPPSPCDVVQNVHTFGRTTHVQTTAVKGLLIFDKMFEGTRSIAQLFDGGAALFSDGMLVDIVRCKKICDVHSVRVVAVRCFGGWCVVTCDNGTISCRYIDMATGAENVLSLQISGSDVVSYGERIFVVTEQGLTEIILMNMRSIIASCGTTWSSVRHATKWFHGFGVEDMMGKMHIVAPFGDRSCMTIRVPELDGQKPIIGRAGQRFITIITVDKIGMYHKYELWFDATYRQYTVWHDHVDSADLTITTLPKGVCATIVVDGELNIFVPATGAQTKVSDALIKTGTHLAQIDNTVIYAEDRTIWRVRMK